MTKTKKNTPKAESPILKVVNDSTIKEKESNKADTVQIQTIEVEEKDSVVNLVPSKGKEFHLPIISKKSTEEIAERVNLVYERIEQKEVGLSETNKILDNEFGKDFSKENPVLALQYNQHLSDVARDRSMQKVYIFCFSALAAATLFQVAATIYKKRLL